MRYGAFFNTLNYELSEAFPLWVGLLVDDSREKLYQRYLADLPIMAQNRNAISWDTYLNKYMPKPKKNKPRFDKFEFYLESLDSLTTKKFQKRGD
jgi:hypothetical protein